MKLGFKRTISWYKYRPEITIQPKSERKKMIIWSIQHLEIFLDSLYFHFDVFYISSVEVKYFNALIDNKSFIDHPVKNKQEAYRKPVKMSKSNNNLTGNSLEYLCHQ